LKKILSIIFLLSFFCFNTFAQQPEDEVGKQLKQISKMMNQLKYDDAIKDLQLLRKENNQDFRIMYELGIAYFLKKNYNYATLVFEELLKMKNINAECYEMFGNILADNHQPARALEIYKKGIEKFPDAGNLYFQIGNLYLNNKRYNEAINAYESGINAAPGFALNYYKASELFCYSNEEVWGMIYGEIYLNLDNNGKHFKEVSKMLYDTYLSEIKFTNDSTISVSFSQQNFSSTQNDFGTNVYEPTLEDALKKTTSIDLNSLDKVRAKFIEIYFRKNYQKKYPNVLFDYLNDIKKSGQMEAYNHWIFRFGNETSFEIWKAKNQSKWYEFLNWYKSHQLEINANNKFLRKNYQ
jgi:tetratricopeptide (TPR) repeat protein